MKLAGEEHLAEGQHLVRDEIHTAKTLSIGSRPVSLDPFLYMSLYDSLTRSSSNLKRRLFDSSIKQLGRTVRVVRIQYQEDMYKDLTNIEALSHNEISAIIKFNEDVPLNRYRMDGTDYVDDTRTFMFDVLPTEIYTRFEDSLELRDLIFFWLTDENDNKIPMLLQITEIFGRFESSLIYKKSYAAPVYGSLTQPLYQLLKNYYTAEKLGTEADSPLLRERPEEAPDPVLVRERRMKDMML